MSYTIEQFSDEPIILINLHDDFDMIAEHIEFENNGVYLLEHAHTSSFVLLNVHVSLDFGELLLAINFNGTGHHPIFNHPNLQELVVVTDDPTIGAFAHGLEDDLFGHVKNYVCTTIEEALDHIRAQY